MKARRLKGSGGLDRLTVVEMDEPGAPFVRRCFPLFEQKRLQTLIDSSETAGFGHSMPVHSRKTMRASGCKFLVFSGWSVAVKGQPCIPGHGVTKLSTNGISDWQRMKAQHLHLPNPQVWYGREMRKRSTWKV
jgi:hypothetical protein